MLTAENHQYAPMGRVTIRKAQEILKEEQELLQDLENVNFDLEMMYQSDYGVS